MERWEGSWDEKTYQMLLVVLVPSVVFWVSSNCLGIWNVRLSVSKGFELSAKTLFEACRGRWRCDFLCSLAPRGSTDLGSGTGAAAGKEASGLGTWYMQNREASGEKSIGNLSYVQKNWSLLWKKMDLWEFQEDSCFAVRPRAVLLDSLRLCTLPRVYLRVLLS